MWCFTLAPAVVDILTSVMVIEAQASGDLLEPASLPGLTPLLPKLFTLNASLVKEHPLSFSLILGQQMSLYLTRLVAVPTQMHFGQDIFHVKSQWSQLLIPAYCGFPFFFFVTAFVIM